MSDTEMKTCPECNGSGKKEHRGAWGSHPVYSKMFKGTQTTCRMCWGLRSVRVRKKGRSND